MNLIDQLSEVFTGIPRYIWEPIGRRESGLNPFAWNNSGEDSRGLYQINVRANPKYADVNLFDPVTNATIARNDFIAPAWAKAKTLFTDPGDQAAYVWRYGIRPNWAKVTQEGADQLLMAEARSIAGTSGISAGVEKGSRPITVPDSNNPLSGEFWVRAGLSSLWVLVLVLLVVVGGVGIGRAFGADQAISGVVKQVAKGVS
jgi:hypothetical protein